MRAPSSPAARLRRLAAFVFCLATAASADGQTGLPGLLRDIAISPTPQYQALLPATATFVTRGGELYFSSWDLTDGLELRASDGTAAGTRTVRDVCPGSCSGFYGYELVESEGVLYFTGDDGLHGTELWRSDGTRAGTRMVVEIIPGRNGIPPLFLTPAPGGVYFSASDGTHGWELWWSDGTAAGTHMVIDLLPNGVSGDGEGPSHLAFLPGLGLVFAAEDGSHGRELWLTQGTAATTTMLADARPGTASGLTWYQPYPTTFFGPAVAGGKVYFTANDGVHGDEPWVTDGTPAGTTMVADVYPGSAGSDAYAYFAFGSAVLFDAGEAGWPSTLWRSDGTAAGTLPLGDAAHGSAELGPYVYAELGGVVYFPGYQTATGRELWVTDGTLEGTHLAVELLPGAMGGVLAFHSFAAAAGRLWFTGDDGVHGVEWWQSDGSGAGTFQITDLAVGSSWSVDPWNTGRPAAIGSHVLLTAFDADRGMAVRASEPGSTGLSVIQAAGDRAGSVPFCTLWICPAEMTSTPGGVAFSAFDGPHGIEPWRSDGSDVGTQLVADIAPGAAWSMSLYGTPRNRAALGDDLLLVASDCADTGGGCSEADVQLWRANADGTTALLTDEAWTIAPGDLVTWQGAGYFGGEDAVWKSDGAAAGTAPLGATGGAHGFVPGATSLYFVADGLWKTDGTGAGTIPIVSSSGPFGPRRLVLTDDGQGHEVLYFAAGDAAAGNELWTSDGSDVGTRRVVDLRAGTGSAIPSPEPVGPAEPSRVVAALGSRVVFAGDDGASGDELWISDGTPGNATLLEIRAGDAGSEPRDLTTVGGRVYFVADDGVNGREPWVTDGTIGGTHMVVDVRPGAASSSPMELTDWMGRLVFAADDDVHGMELWRGDADGNSAQLVTDLRPGVEPSSPQGLTAVGERLYFFADDGTTGLEPWMWSAAADLFKDGFETGSFARWSRVTQ